MKVSFFTPTPAGFSDDTVVEVHAGVEPGTSIVTVDGVLSGRITDRGDAARGYRFSVATADGFALGAANSEVACVTALLDLLADRDSEAMAAARRDSGVVVSVCGEFEVSTAVWDEDDGRWELSHWCENCGLARSEHGEPDPMASEVRS